MKAVVTARPAPHRVDATADGIDPYRFNLGLLALRPILALIPGISQTVKPDLKLHAHLCWC